MREHPYGRVDQVNLLLREVVRHLREKLVGQLHIIDAVVSVPRQLIGLEVCQAFPLGVNNFFAFLANLIAFSQCF